MRDLLHPPYAQRFLPSETPLYVRFADVDMMHVVHHAAYLHWFEQIRFRFLTEVLGLPLDRLVTAGVALPLTSCEVQFRRSVKFGQQPVGYARMLSAKQAIVKLSYTIYDRVSGELLATGTTTHCFVGPGQQLLLRIPGFFEDAMQAAVARLPDCRIDAEALP